MVCDFLDSAGYIGEVGGAVGAQDANVLSGADGMVDDGTLAGLELEGQSHGFERQQQVGKDDGRVHTELFSGSDGDFAASSGCLQISTRVWCLRTSRYSCM